MRNTPSDDRPQASGSDVSPTLRLVPSTPGVAFVGTYPPRRCGIATFTQDLSRAIVAAGERFTPIVIAISDASGQYDYPREVGYEIRQGIKGDYARAAEFVNYSDVRLVSIQHEYGIFGGDDGAYVLDFVSALRVPAIVTLHTVLATPSDGQKQIVRRLEERCGRLVVMSEVAADLLGRSYGVDASRVQIIPHGIPDIRRGHQQSFKARFGVAGQQMLLTFGLLSPNKGIETVIRALPALVAHVPDLKYFVVGLTHPVIARSQGEAYRTTLEREADRLGVRDHVVFRDQFVSNEELCTYLQATDIFVSPYQNEAQVTSGALTYAMGAGAAVVSTPYWHAQELLGSGRGRLFPFGDSAALAVVLKELLDAPTEVERVRAAAYEFTRPMVWPRVGKAYLDVGVSLMRDRPPTPPVPAPLAMASLPELRLDHLLRMTDDVGVIQHATFSVPARSSGYCVDDNARALIVALGADNLGVAPSETRRLVTGYLAYLHMSQRPDGNLENLMSYSRQLQVDSGSEDCLGRALWALGATMLSAADDGSRKLAREMFRRALPRAAQSGPRGTALTILGLANYLGAEGEFAEGRTLIGTLADRLVGCYQQTASAGWRWFERSVSYDNALLPLALFRAHRFTRDRGTLRIARESLEFLEETCFEGDRLTLVGNAGWLARGGPKAPADEQPIDAASFVLAFRGAFVATGERHYLRRMSHAFAWFLGDNRLGVPVYDFGTGGCRDGVGVKEVNQNEGAESTISFLLALLEMMDVAGETVDRQSDRPLTRT